MNKTLNQCTGAISKNCFCSILSPFSCFFSFFNFLGQKTLKKHILTSLWSVQHPKAGQNIQHPFLHSFSSFFFFLAKKDVKTKNNNLTSERCRKRPLAGQNTQQFIIAFQNTPNCLCKNKPKCKAQSRSKQAG